MHKQIALILRDEDTGEERRAILPDEVPFSFKARDKYWQMILELLELLGYKYD